MRKTCHCLCVSAPLLLQAVFPRLLRAAAAEREEAVRVDVLAAVKDIMAAVASAAARGGAAEAGADK